MSLLSFFDYHAPEVHPMPKQINQVHDKFCCRIPQQQCNAFATWPTHTQVFGDHRFFGVWLSLWQEPASLERR